MSQHSSAWNQHKIGATLLDNWVEERAVGDQILVEKNNIATLSRQGHQVSRFNKNLITNCDKMEFKSTSQETYQIPGKIIDTMGKRRQLLQQELLKLACEKETKPIEMNNYKTTNAIDYCHDKVVKKLGSQKPNESVLSKFEKPITFWTDYAAKGSGTAICSTNASELHDQCHPMVKGVYGHKAGQVHQHEASAVPIRFGIHPSFSTNGECE
jgi:hypothetical protein